MSFFLYSSFGMIFVVGIILAVLTSMIDKAASKCNNDAVRNSNKGVLVLSVLFMIVPIAYAVCRYTCNCGKHPEMVISTYAVFFWFLSIVLISLGAVIQDNAKKSGCSKAIGPAMGIWIMGSAILILTTIILSVEIGRRMGIKIPKVNRSTK